MRQGLLALLVSAGLVGGAVAQDASGSISGTVADEQGSVLPGATVTLINETTKLARTGTSDARGDFRFTTLVPGAYTIKVELQGFKAYERKNNVLNAASSLSVGTLKLGLGAMTEVISVVDAGTKVNVEETQHSGLLTSTQIEQLQSKGRDVVNLLRTMPGVRYGADNDALGDSFGTVIPNINGQREHWNKSTIDGMTATESGGASRLGSAISLDAIAEVKVLLNTYRAEFGGTGGAQIQIVSRGGGADYRGTMYWLGRRTNWNANTWANNWARDTSNNPPGSTGLLPDGSTGSLHENPRPAYDFNTFGFNLGGPIPGQKEKKLFFFYNLEMPRSNRDTQNRRYMVPTEAERRGDFSNTFQYGQTSTRVQVLDPVTGNPLPNNQVPANLIDRNMQALMNMYPLPNRTDMSVTNNQYNFETTLPHNNPRQNHTLRLDWKPTDKDSVFVSGLMHRSLQEGGDAPGFNAAGKWGLYNPTYDFGNAQVNFGHTRIFSSNVINEFQAGYRNQWEKFGFLTDADRNRLVGAANGYNGSQFFPANNPNGFIPQIAVQNLTGTGIDAANFTYDNRNGETANDYILSIRDNLTWTKSAHTFKVGGLYEHFTQNEARGGNYMGSFTFNNANRATNPLSSTVPYANFLMGAFSSYSEIDGRQDTANRQGRLEWYVQDTWKASRRLTLDLGMRFLWYQQWYQGGDILHAAFAPERYVLGASPRLYVPGNGAAVDPANPNDRRTPAAAFQGRFVPNSGNAGNGMVLSNDTSYPRGFRDQLGIHPEPSIGIAYDVFGNQKTNLHSGFRLGHQGYMGGGYQGNLRGVPAQNVLTIPNGRTADFLSTAGFSGPSGVAGLQRDAKTPSAYSFSLGVTQDIGWGSVVDVSYVGVLNRHMDTSRNINAVPNGANCLGTTAAPCAPLTSVVTDVRTINLINPLTGARWPSDDFRRPYEGFQNIGMHEHWATANYNALQVQLTRRYIKGLQFSAAYTFSKALGNGDNDPGNDESISPWIPLERYYSPLTHNQTHNFVGNFTYDFPRIGGPAPVKLLFDNWQISSEYVWASGDWQGLTLDMNPDVNFTGGSNCASLGCEGGASLVMLRNPRRKGGSAFDPANPWFDVDAFAAPTLNNLGNVPRTVIQRPPINNLNASLFKNFGLGGSRRMQLRLEAYNVLNHTQISEIGRTLQFNSVTGELTNRAKPPATPTTPQGAGPGIASAARPPRILQASVRFNF
jgi:hypothetical protein